MRFEEFAAAHGLLLRHVEFGKWVRVPTTDHPGKKNGAYRHMGTHAHVQNHADDGGGCYLVSGLIRRHPHRR
jgi:putative DNA primase/helicase